jgi:hypothetical protein
MPAEKRHRPTAIVRLPGELLTVIDTWADAQSDLPRRPEAIRRLVEKAVKGE